MGLFMSQMLPDVLEYCIEAPVKITLEIKNFYIEPSEKKHPTGQYERVYLSNTEDQPGPALELATTQTFQSDGRGRGRSNILGNGPYRAGLKTTVILISSIRRDS